MYRKMSGRIKKEMEKTHRKEDLGRVIKPSARPLSGRGKQTFFRLKQSTLAKNKLKPN